MAIRKRKGRASPYQVYWNNPFTGKRESASFASLAEARKHESIIKHRLQFERDSFRSDEEEIVTTGGTVREIIALYLADKNFSGENLRNTLDHLKFVIRAFGNREATGMTKKDLVKFITDANKVGVSFSTSHRRLAILRSAFSWAIETDVMEVNPLAGIKLPKGKTKKYAPPTQSEAIALREAAAPHTKRAIILGASLGMRIGPTELFRLEWRDMDFQRAMLRVWGADKGYDRPYRDVPIRTSLLEIMREWSREDSEKGYGFIIHYNGKQISSIKRSWKKAKEKAGITRELRPYDLRHAFVTNALDAGNDPGTVADITGHRVDTLMKHYRHTKEAGRREVVESLPDFSGHVPTVCAQEKKGLSDEG